MKRLIPIFVLLALGLGIAMYVHYSKPKDGESSLISRFAGEKVAPAPPGWLPPPPIGTKGYQGPPPHLPMRMSPYAAATAKGVKRQRRIKRTSDDALRKRLGEYLAERKGKILFIGRKAEPQDDFGALKARFVNWKSSADLGEMVNALAKEGDSEKKLADKLAALGVQWVLIDRYVVKTVGWHNDRADAILHRLSWSHPLEWFHPKLIGRTYLLYRVAPPLELTEEQGRALVTYVRMSLTGEEPKPDIDFQLPGGAGGNELQEVSVGLRQRASNIVPGRVKAGRSKKTGKPKYKHAGLWGKKVITRSSRRQTLKQAVDVAVEKLRNGWKRRRENAWQRYQVKLPESIADAIRVMEIELDVHFDRSEVTDRDLRRVGEMLELGVDGAFLEYMKGEEPRRVNLLPAFALQRLLKAKGPRMFTSYLSKDLAGLDENGWQDTSRTFGRFRTRCFLELEAGGKVVPTFRASPLIDVSDVTRENLIAALERGCDFLARNQIKPGMEGYSSAEIAEQEGLFRYKYWAHTDRWIKGKNVVRHALNPYTVLMAQQYAPHPTKWIAAAEAGIGYTLRHVKCEGEGQQKHCYIPHADPPGRYETAKIGTVAVTILSMIRLSEFKKLTERQEETLRHLGNHLVHMQDPNGHYRQYYVEPDHPYFGCTNAIFPGEIQFSLSRLYGYFKDERYKKAFDKGVKYYTEWWRINSGKEQEDGTYTEEVRADTVGFVPWQCMAMEDMYRHTKDRSYADFALKLQLWMDGHFLYTPNRSVYPDYLGASFKFHGEQPAINSCGYTEGCAAAYSLAKQVGEHQDFLRNNLVWGLRFAMQVQYRGPETSYFLPKPHVALGGFRYCLNRLRLRNDYSYHALSAIYQGLKFLEPEDYPGYVAPAAPAPEEQGAKPAPAPTPAP